LAAAVTLGGGSHLRALGDDSWTLGDDSWRRLLGMTLGGTVDMLFFSSFAILAYTQSLLSSLLYF
jgi:hypothetical protein